jgi:catechol 2,3-dioxygenase-like lactoylglutathione lyase family enzyme
MQIVNKLTMLLMIVSNMPKTKAFYTETLGLKITTEYRQDDEHWWVTFSLPEGGVSVNVTTFRENGRLGTITLYFATSDVATAHKELSDKGIPVDDVKDDLYGPGSGVKWCKLDDPDGNQVYLVQA